MKFPWRRRPGRQQSVADSVVLGDAIQIAGVAGDVTIVSDRAQFRVEDFPLLTASVARDRARAQPSRLLHPRYQVVPFIGRHDELAALNEWMARTDALGVRLFHASGGQGKTRLAAHYAAQAAAAGWAVWRAVYTPDSDTGSAPLHLGDCRGVLVVVDYADRWLLTHLRALIAKLHALTQWPGVLVRVLMVARSSAHWWPALAHDLEGDFDIDAEAIELSPLGTQIDRATLFGAAAVAFAAVMGAEYDLRDGPPAEIELSDSGFSSVLSLHLAALVTIDSQLRGAEMPGDPAALSGYLLRREYVHWAKLFEIGHIAARPETMHRVVWLATLVGAVTPHLAESILQHLGLASTPEKVHELADDHRRLYPPEDPRTVLEALRPDRLGEDLVALSIPGRASGGNGITIASDAWTGSALWRLLTAAEGRESEIAWWTPQIVTSLVETARRWPHVAEELLFPLIRQHPQVLVAAGDATIDRFVKLAGIDLVVLTALESCFPEHCRDLGSASTVALISGRAYPLRLAAATDPAARAVVHRRHAQRLNDAGLFADAMAAAGAAAHLVATTPIADRAELAAIQAQLAIAGFRLERTDGVVDYARSAMSLYLSLPSRDRGEHLTDIARLASDYGKWLTVSGSAEEALAMIDTAVEVGRTLAQEDSEDHSALAALAAALHDLGNQLSVMGSDAALGVVEEAVALRRSLVDWEPYDHLGDLAASLGLLSTRLFRAGRWENALAACREAVLIRRELARRNPVVHLPDCVAALRQMVDQLLELGHRAEAVDPLEEAVRGLRILVERDAAYREELAATLHLFGELLVEQDRLAESVTAAEESLGLRRQLIEAAPNRQLRPLALALDTASARLARAGRAERAADLALEAAKLHVVISRRRTDDDPARLPELAAALVEVGRLDAAHAAVEAADEAVELYRTLLERDSAAQLPDLAEALLVLGGVLLRESWDERAIVASEEAVELFDGLAAAAPDVYLSRLAAALLQLALAYAQSDQLTEAVAAARDAGGHYRLLLRADSPAPLLGLARSAEYLSVWFERLGRPVEALAPAKQAVAAYRELVGDDPAQLPQLAAALHQFARVGMLTGRDIPNVYPAVRESVTIYRELNAVTPGSFEAEYRQARTTLSAVIQYFQHYWKWVAEMQAEQSRNSNNDYF
ncbi:tetratricopeptide repeat protein [Nocardia sp. NPDC052566]|uniref:tetratricopeptide repeat protein n=1 Tax=Nocardia sp. NPDC052566 TaxID=3364330 RepID=UPI0037CB3C5E